MGNAHGKAGGGGVIISVINHTNGKIADEAVQAAIRAINRQIAYDFAPHWNFAATLRLEGRSSRDPKPQSLADMRGDAVLYLWDKTNVPGALGYHDTANSGVPCGFVFTELSKLLKESWTTTFSHEALELLGDPEVNLMARGPHPVHPKQTVFHWYEMCDAVQGEKYKIDGIEVANFVLPLYFTSGEERGGRNDFLGRAYRGKTLRSFGVQPGGYIGFYNPLTNKNETYSTRGDAAAARRIKLKQAAGKTRRTVRHQGAAGADD
jgi:hypothetical protein